METVWQCNNNTLDVTKGEEETSPATKMAETEVCGHEDCISVGENLKYTKSDTKDVESWEIEEGMWNPKNAPTKKSTDGRVEENIVHGHGDDSLPCFPYLCAVSTSSYYFWKIKVLEVEKNRLFVHKRRRTNENTATCDGIFVVSGEPQRSWKPEP